ncbi:MAG: beta strand repeat-containing protein [Novosphingobium sp.]
MPPIDGTSGPDILNGTSGDDVINGLGGNDTIDGGDGNDTIFGGAGVDNMSGGNGDDTFVEDTFSSAGETFNGGAGTDTIELRVLAGVPTPFPSAVGLLSPHGFTSATLTSIERLVYASTAGNTVQGVLNYSTWSASGLTQIVGGAGRDLLSLTVGTAAGTYTMPSLPLSGWDSVPLNAWEGGDFVSLASAAPAGTSVTLNALSGATFLQILSGGAGDDILNGSGNADMFEASRGADQVNAGGGNDLIVIANVAPVGPTGWGPPSTFTGAGGTWNGGSGTDAISIGGDVSLQATLTSIEGVILQAEYGPVTPTAPRQYAAVLRLDQAHLAMLPAATFWGGTGSVEVTLDFGGSFNGSQYTFLAGADVNFRITTADGNGVSVVGTSRGDYISLGAGTQTVTGGGGNDTFSVAGGIVTITDFTRGQDLFDLGGSGLISMARVQDFLVQQAGGAAFVADTGGEHIEVRMNGVQASALTSTDFILSTDNFTQVDAGTAFADIQFGRGADDQLHGADGADRIYSGGGADQLFGDAGNDIIILDGAINPTGFFGAPIIDGGTGQDTLVLRSFGGSAFSSHNLYFASTVAGIETLQFDSKIGQTVTGVMVLQQYAASGITAVVGGAGTDQLALVAIASGAVMPNVAVSNWTNGPGGDVVALVVANTDTVGMTLTALEGASFNQALIGAAGADTLNGSSAADVLIGNAGDDVLDGRLGADTMTGGLGNDTYYVDQQADLAFENAAGGIDTVVASNDFYLYGNIENLMLTSGSNGWYGVGNELANTITGNAGGNLLIGGLGDDSISGGAGNDLLFGEDGADTLGGDAGIDYLVGGAGGDTLNGGADADALYGGDGNDAITGGSDFVTDIMVGGLGNDTLFANSGLGDYDILNGAEGDDTYYVDTPDDIIFEGLGEGTDTVIADIAGAGYYLWANVENCILAGTTPFAAGNDLNNVLTGSASSNWLLGNDGNDTLNGKGGNDVLFGDRPGGTAGTDTFVFDAASGQDVIGDFHHAEDKIQLNGIYADFAQAQTHFVQSGSDGAIDLGGGNFVVLIGVTMATLTAGDFQFG